ncbi:MAG: futalosine hydrolase [Prevotellaceae bacterium]|jgi:futalosine hydrolase|nr:futalosine hydrolase [Prevotellaceae bacterium]
MMILVTAATDMELQHVLQNSGVVCMNTGIGMVSTACKLGHAPLEKYDMILNIGIAGSFSPALAIGDTVTVYSETFGDFGILSEQGFSTCFDEGLLSPDFFPFSQCVLTSKNAGTVSEKLSIPQVKGVTNNTVSGEKNRIKLMSDKFSPDIETMESAAFFYVCLQRNVNFASIRAISNMVEPRNRKNWNIPLAVKNLSEKVNTYIEMILK